MILLKDAEHDYLSLNVPTALWILWIIFIFDNFLWKFCFFVLFIVVLVNLAVAFEEKKENIKVYDKVINKKLKDQNEKNDRYQKEILRYLKNIEKGLNDK